MKVSHTDEISSDSISPTAHSDADDTGDLAFNPSDDSDQDAAVTAFWASPRFGHPHSQIPSVLGIPCLLYTSDAADE